MYALENFQAFVLIQFDFVSSNFGICYLNIHFYSQNLILNAFFFVSNIKPALKRKRYAIIEDPEINVLAPERLLKDIPKMFRTMTIA